MTRYAVDWDDTLVDVRTQEWLPGALEWLRQHILTGDEIVIHTCRANWPEGHASVEAKLAAERLHLTVVGKPAADVYIDDKAEKPDWGSLEVTRNGRKIRGRIVERVQRGIVVY